MSSECRNSWVGSASTRSNQQSGFHAESVQMVYPKSSNTGFMETSHTRVEPENPSVGLSMVLRRLRQGIGQINNLHLKISESLPTHVPTWKFIRYPFKE